MFCLMSFIFVFVIVGQLEAGSITTVQAIFYEAYVLLMFYHTSKSYWKCEKSKENKKNRSR